MKILTTSETAVSEAVGFILTLSIVLLASWIVYASAPNILQSSLKSSHFVEMEESFNLLAQNINEVAYERAPIRNTELKILDSSLSINHDSSIRVIVNGTIYTYNMGSLEYYLDGHTIAYENGGLWTKYDTNGSIMRSKPHLNYANVTTIPVVELLGSDSKSGEGIARIRVEYSDTSSIYFINATDNDSTVFDTTVFITSSFYKGWATYLEDELEASDVTIYDSNQTVSAILTTSQIYVDVNRLQVEIF